MTDRRSLANWLLRLVSLDALATYLVAQGWQRQTHPNQNIQVYTNQAIVYDDGTHVEMVLPAAQTWDWPSYRETAIALLAAAEDRDEILIVTDLLDLDVSDLTVRFAAANPPAGSVPF